MTRITFQAKLIEVLEDIRDALETISRRPDQTINQKLDLIINKEKQMAIQVDDVLAALAEETAIDQKAIVLLEQLHGAITAAGTDPVKLQAVLDTINSNKNALAAAVAANTPPAPPTP